VGQPTETLKVVTHGLAKHVQHIQLTAATLLALLPRNAALSALDSIHAQHWRSQGQQ
jgi:hypothetical protein